VPATVQVQDKQERDDCVMGIAAVLVRQPHDALPHFKPVCFMLVKCSSEATQALCRR
jgi:hypothetical protein